MKLGEIVNKGIEVVKSIWTKEYSKWIRFGIITGLSITIAIYLTVISIAMLTLYILTTAYWMYKFYKLGYKDAVNKLTNIQ
jgi:hypothetical protein